MTPGTGDWDDETRAALAAFLERHGLTRGAVRTRVIGDGHSNVTCLVADDDGRTVVVRRPPPPPTPPGAHDVLREARLVGALAATPVPVADVLATAEAGEVIDVPLFVMSVASGAVITTETPAALADPATRRRIGVALVDTLAELHLVDRQAVGLADMGRPAGFNRRHLRRMGGLVADGQGNLPRSFAVAGAWLEAHAPEESGAAIVHNDYRIGNVVISTDRPGEVEAVLDWELSTVGDPLLDLGFFLSSIPTPDSAGWTPTQQMSTAMLEDGYPAPDDLAARYQQRTGADLRGLSWYVALAQWKLGVLYEYGRRRAVAGTGDPYYADPSMVRSFLDAAHRAAGLPAAPALVPETESS